MVGLFFAFGSASGLSLLKGLYLIGFKCSIDVLFCLSMVLPMAL
jgi:hypothetical protein